MILKNVCARFYVNLSYNGCIALCIEEAGMNTDDREKAPDESTDYCDNGTNEDSSKTDDGSRQETNTVDQNSTNELENVNDDTPLIADADYERRKETAEVNGGEESVMFNSNGNTVAETAEGDAGIEPVPEKRIVSDAAKTGVVYEQKDAVASGIREGIDHVEESKRCQNAAEMHSAINASNKDETSKMMNGTVDDEDDSESRERETKDTTATDTGSQLTERSRGYQGGAEVASVTTAAGENVAMSTEELQTSQTAEAEKNDDQLQADKHRAHQDAANAADLTEENYVTTSTGHNDDDVNGTDPLNEGRQQLIDSERTISRGQCDNAIDTCNDTAHSVLAELGGCQNAADIVADENDASSLCERQIPPSVVTDKDISSGLDKCAQKDAALSAEQMKENSITAATGRPTYIGEGGDEAEQLGENCQEQVDEDLSHHHTAVDQSAPNTLEADSSKSTTCSSTDEDTTKDADKPFTEEVHSLKNDKISASSLDNRESTGSEIQQDGVKAQQTVSTDENNDITEGEGGKVTETSSGITASSQHELTTDVHPTSSQPVLNTNVDNTKETVDNEINAEEIKPPDSGVEDKVAKVPTAALPHSTTDAATNSEATEMSDSEDKARRTSSPVTNQTDKNASTTPSSSRYGTVVTYCYLNK